MKKRAMMTLILLLCVLTACGQAPSRGEETLLETTAATEIEIETEPTAKSTGLEDVEALLNLSKEEAAGHLGGGEENWTEDKSFFIGHIYQTDLFGTPVKVYTTYGQDDTVASVSVSITEEGQNVTEEDVQSWVERLNEYASGEAIYNGQSSESGSRNWKWKKDDVFIALHWLGDLVSIDMQPAIGELK